MNKQTEALKLALEAYLYREMPAGTIIGDPKWWVPKIAMAIREALAEQPAQEPVAWASLIGQYAHIVWGKQRPDDEIHTIPLYTSPPAQPPQRNPLTDEQILHLVDIHVGAPSTAYPLDTSDWLCFARAIEAAHGIGEKK